MATWRSHGLRIPGWGLLALLPLIAPVRAGEDPSWRPAASAAWVLPPPALAPAEGATNGLSIAYRLVDDQVAVANAAHYRCTIERIINEEGVQSAGTLSFEFHPAFETLAIHRILVRRGGHESSRLHPAKARVLNVETDRDRYLYRGSVSVVFVLEDIRAGDELEFASTITGANPVFEDRYADQFGMGWTTPMDWRRVRLLVPRDRRLTHLVIGPPGGEGEAMPLRERRLPDGEGAMQELTWEGGPIPAIWVEDRLPAEFVPLPYLQVSEWPDWKAVAAWAAQHFDVPTAVPSALVDPLADWKALPAGEPRARAALDFVQNEIRYESIALGPHSHRPYAPATVVERRFGDCKDKSLLLVTLLRALGLSAEPLLVNSEVAGALVDRLPSPLEFDHAVVLAHLPSGSIVLDPTRGFQRGPLTNRPVPAYAAGLRVNADADALDDLRAACPRTRRTEIRETFHLGKIDEPGTLTIETKTLGCDAEDLRSYFSTARPDEIGRNYLNYYARFHPDIEATASPVLTDDPESGVARVYEAYRIPRPWRDAGKGEPREVAFIPTSLSDEIEAPSVRQRRAPLAVPFPREMTVHTVVHLPEDWPAADADEEVRGPAGRLRVKRRCGDLRLDIEYQYESLTNVVPVAQVPEHLEALQRMDDEVGYSLTWAELETDRPHWMLRSVAGMYLLLLVAGAVQVYRLQPAQAPPVLPGSVTGPIGLGGWLILVGLQVLIMPLYTIVLMLSDVSAYTQPTWDQLTQPGASAYHPLWGPILLFELLTSLTRLVLVGFAAVLFLQRRRWFPRAYTAVLLVTAFVLLVDALAAFVLPALRDDPKALREAVRDGVRGLLACAIWIPYIHRSVRVRNTFTR